MALLFDGYLNRARAYLQHEQWEEALRAIRGALHILPTAREAVQCQVDILCGMQEWEQAAEALELALCAHPYWPWAILELVDLMVLRLQRSEQVWRWLQRLRLCHHLSSEERIRGRILQANALLDQERLYEASLCLRNALKDDPRHPQLLFLDGLISLQLNNYYAAASAFHKVLAQDKEHAEAHYHLGWTFRGLDQLRLMREHFRITYELDQLDPTPLRFSPSMFLQLAHEALHQHGQADYCASIQVATEVMPSRSILEEFPHDPRRLGVLVRDETSPFWDEEQGLPQGTLILFQRNVERLCFSEQDIRDEIVHIVHRELAAFSAWQPAHPLPDTNDTPVEASDSAHG